MSEYTYRLQVESLLSNGFMWAGDYETREDAQSAFLQAYGGEDRKFMITRVRTPE